MRKILFMLSVFMIGTASWAESSGSRSPRSKEPMRKESCDEVCRQEQKKKTEIPSPGEPGMTSTAEASEVTRGYLKDEKVGIKPQIGVLAFTDAVGEQTARAAYGLTADFNIAQMIDEDFKKVYLGASTGVIYSHLGAPGSNLVGGNPSNNQGTAGANMLVIPANLKAAYNLTDDFRVGIHGGGNVVYRSIASASYLGDSSNTTDSVWRVFPNAGADFELGLGEHAALMFRPDWTFTPGTDFFIGTLALNIPFT